MAKVGSLGRYDCILGKDAEQALVDNALKLQQMFFGLNTKEFRKLAYELAEKMKIDHMMMTTTMIQSSTTLTQLRITMTMTCKLILSVNISVCKKELVEGKWLYAHPKP